MPDADGPSAWDFLTLVKWWNLFALPALLLATGAFVLIKGRRLDRRDRALAGRDGRGLVRIVSLIHLGISAHAAVRLVQELLTMRVMGVSESFVNLIEESISCVVNPLLSLGLWLARPAARWLAIAWYVLLSVIGVIGFAWLWRYHVPVEPRSWPEHLAGKLMPFFLLVVMFLPRVKRAFARSKTGPAEDLEPEPNQVVPDAGRRWSTFSLIALLFLIVVVSNLAVDTADWIERSVAEWNET